MLRGEGLSVCTHFFVPSKSALQLRRMQYPVYRRRDLQFTTKALSRTELASLYAQSVCVLDSPQSGQSGLTMRTIEAMGAGRKVVTTNPEVTKYDFYEYGDFLNPEDMEGVLRFCSERKRGTPAEVRLQYSLSSWVKNMSELMELK